MGFWSKLWLGADAGEPAARSPFDPRFWGADIMSTMAGLPITWQTPLGLDVVQSVLGRLSGTCSTLPLMVYKRKGQEQRTPARKHPLYKLLHRRPNAYQTAVEFRADLVFQLAYWRNAYCEIVADPETGAPIGSLEPIHASRLKSIKRIGGRRLYTFAPLEGEIGDLILWEDRVWHIRLAPLTTDGLRGKAVWEDSKEVFGRAIAVENFGALFFRNGGTGGGVVTIPGQFKDKEEQARFLEAWRAGGTGLNRHKDRLALNGATYQPFQVNNDEAQFLETKKEMGNAVCRLWSFPPHMAGLLDKATNNNIEQQSLEFVMYTLQPYLSAIEQAAWRDLLIGDDQDKYFVEHNVAGLLRGDFKTRWGGYMQGRQWGWLSVNDVRRLENMPDIGEQGDVYLQPMNMTPAGQPAADNPAKPGKPDPEADDPENRPQEDDDAP